MKIVFFVLVGLALLMGLSSCYYPHAAYHRPPLPPPPGLGIFHPKPHYKPYQNNRYRRYQRNRHYYDYDRY